MAISRRAGTIDQTQDFFDFRNIDIAKKVFSIYASIRVFCGETPCFQFSRVMCIFMGQKHYGNAVVRGIL
jgi:hypothetical protein